MFGKRTRIENRALLNRISREPCTICGKRPADPDHITTRGAGGDDTPECVWPLCRLCHIERHKIGLSKLAEKYPNAKVALEGRGWRYEGYLGRWLRDRG